ncbi:hypothetical protein LCGC14_2826860, partial [marine sediment metagenome]
MLRKNIGYLNPQKMRQIKVISLLCCLFVFLTSCKQMEYSRNTEFFKETKAYNLAKAVEDGNIDTVENLVKEDSTLLNVNNPVSGSSVLFLAIYVEEFEAFKKLLELGADPNTTNPYTKYSILIEAIRPFGSQLEWREDHRYVELLLKYKANSTYALEDDFINEKGNHIMATSPLMRASSLNLALVKLLIENGADPYRELGAKQRMPLGEALEASILDIVNYYNITSDDSSEIADIIAPIHVRGKIKISAFVLKARSYQKIKSKE